MASTRVFEEDTTAYTSGDLASKTFTASDVAYRMDVQIDATSRQVILRVVTPDGTARNTVMFGGVSLTALQHYTECFAVPSGSTISVRFSGACTVGWVIIDHVPGSVI